MSRTGRRGLSGSKTGNHSNCKRHNSSLLEALPALVGDPHTWLCWVALRPMDFEALLALAEGKLALSSCPTTLASTVLQHSPASLVPRLALCCLGKYLFLF